MRTEGTPPDLSIVVPCLNEAENVEPLFVAIAKEILSAFPDLSYEVLFIDNGSKDGTPDRLRQLVQKNPGVAKAILNRRNFGHIRSPIHGLYCAEGRAILAMAADFQDPPALIPELVRRWKQGAEAVLAVRRFRKEGTLLRLVRSLYYWFLIKLADSELERNFTGFGLYDRKVIDDVKALQDPNPYFRGLITELGVKVDRVFFDQPGRRAGLTKNNFYSLYDLAMLGVTSHSKVPLRLATFVGFLASGFSFLVGMGYLTYKLIFWSQFEVGTAPILVGIFFIGSVQLFFIGILGEYIGSIHTYSQNRPLVYERERLGFSAPAGNKNVG